MDAAAWAGVAVGALGTGWAATAALMGRALRQAAREAVAAVQLGQLRDDVRQQSQRHDQAHAEIAAQMREDRRATDERLRWLETHIWTVQHRTGGP